MTTVYGSFQVLLADTISTAGHKTTFGEFDFVEQVAISVDAVTNNLTLTPDTPGTLTLSVDTPGTLWP